MLTQKMRPELYSEYKDNVHISWCYSDRLEDSKSDPEIIENYIKNNH